MEKVRKAPQLENPYTKHFKKSSARDIGKGIPKGKDTYKGMKCNHVFITSKAGAQ